MLKQFPNFSAHESSVFVVDFDQVSVNNTIPIVLHIACYNTVFLSLNCGSCD